MGLFISSQYIALKSHTHTHTYHSGSRRVARKAVYFSNRNNFEFQISQAFIGKIRFMPHYPVHHLKYRWWYTVHTTNRMNRYWNALSSVCSVYISRRQTNVCLQQRQQQLHERGYTLARYEIILLEIKKTAAAVMVSGNNTPKAEEMNFANIWTEAKRK